MLTDHRIGRVIRRRVGDLLPAPELAGHPTLELAARDAQGHVFPVGQRLDLG